MEWKSLHIFYYDNQDFIIKKGLNNTLCQYNINDFFFIRYWECGPHIRLRIKNISEEIFKLIQNELYNFINLNKSNSQINEKEYINIMKNYYEKEKKEFKIVKLIKNNRIENWEYIPELNKYYGNQGILIAENEFIYSSKLAIEILLLNPSSTKKYLLSSVFMIFLLEVFLVDKKLINNFFDGYLQYWKYFCDLSEEKYFNIKDSFKKYKIENSVILKIKDYFSEKKFKYVHESYLNEIKRLPDFDHRMLLDFSFNFIHLFNNRIGISTYEEVIVSLFAQKIYGGYIYEKI